MANGHGGKREGAGRKPRTEEQKIIEALDKQIDPTEAIGVLKDMIINKKNFRALQLYLNYKWGKPKENININPDNDFNVPITSFFGLGGKDKGEG